MDYIITLEDIERLEDVFENIYLNYKNLVFYLDNCDDKELVLVLEDILNCLYRHLTVFISFLSDNIKGDDLYE